MARDIKSIVKMSRREEYALHPKAHKIMAKRTAMPGQDVQTRFRKKSSQYSLQLREKQKVKRLYGLLERQFSNLMKEASKSKGQSGHTLLRLLEQRADNVVYRAGLAPSRRSARQLVTHGHFKLNGNRFDIPSLRINAGDSLTVREKSKKSDYFKRIDDTSPASEITLSWLSVDRNKLAISVTSTPTREEVEPGIKEQLIVEYYSR
jgi:small subunit ribosomal protein S4